MGRQTALWASQDLNSTTIFFSSRKTMSTNLFNTGKRNKQLCTRGGKRITRLISWKNKVFLTQGDNKQLSFRLSGRRRGGQGVGEINKNNPTLIFLWH